MVRLSAHAQGAVSDSTHKFPWKWYLSDLKNVKKNGKKVFSCFSCGGGSSMGYKLAGYDVIGNVEIDPQMMKVYRENNHPKYSYLMDVRDSLKLDDLPQDLFNLDILDGSPPCSTFSTAGDREKSWGKEKRFREGQKLQTLDDLFFIFIAIAKRLQPKVVVAENVSGLIKGNAKGYVNEIVRKFDDAGYKVQIFLLNAAKMGVPQKRERVFFVCSRKDLNLPKIELSFNEPPILFGKVRSKDGIEMQDGIVKSLMKLRKNTDSCVADISLRERGILSGFNHAIVKDNEVSNTLVATGIIMRMCDGKKYSGQDCTNVQTFPQDYNYLGNEIKYICGMSVPPVMMASLSSEIYNQWLASI